MNIIKWLQDNCINLTGKRVILTGATGGIGKELVYYLSKLGADITICARNIKLAHELQSDLLNKYRCSIDIIPLDLNDMTSVTSAINTIKKYNGIDVLIMNAGVYNVPLERLDTGYNNVFQTNFVSPYYMIKDLLPELRKKASSTVVAVSSIAHNYAKINPYDIDFSNNKKPSEVYGNSKRFLTFALYELFKNEPKIKLSIVHPGITLTNMTNHYPKAINWLVKIGIKLLFPSPRYASLNIIKGLSTPTAYHEWIGPKIFNIWGRPHKKKLKTCNTTESEKIFTIAEDIYEKISHID